MTIEQLKNFIVVAEVLNFRKATEQIYIAQPALSRQIQLLENEIGAPLFDRSRKQVKLTAAGEYFKREAQRLVDQLEQAKKRTAEIHKGEAGEIRIGHVSSVMQSVLPVFLRKIQESVPGLKISLMESSNRLIFQLLHNREIDFGLLPNTLIPATVGSHLVYRENFVLIAPGRYPLYKSSFKGLSAYADAHWILPPRSEGHGYVEVLDRIFQRHGFVPKVVYESPNSSTVLRLVNAGLGLTLIGKSSLNGLDLDIRHVELNSLPEKVEMRLIWLKEREYELKEYNRLFRKFLQ